MSDKATTSTASSGGGADNPRRIKLTEQQLESVSRDELVRNWRELDSHVDLLESQATNQEAEMTTLRETEERARQQHQESTHRERVLVRRLATKEQEMQDYVSQITELKAAQAPGAAALRSALLDPAVNLLLQRLRQELVTTKTRLEETQNELSAWKFTPDSNTGKRLMAKCRLLYQENEELGRMISSGRLAKLEGDLALQKSFSEEVKKSQSELDEILQDLDEDVEGMQSTIYYLQQELRKTKETLVSVQQENTLLKTGNALTTEKMDGVGDSEVVRESSPRTPISASSTPYHNGVEVKVEEDSRGWEVRTQGSDKASPKDPTPPSPPPEGGDSSSAVNNPPPPPPEEDSVSCDVNTRPRSPHEPEPRTFDESDESVPCRPPSPPPQPTSRKWSKHNHDESSSDSGELILKLEADDMGEDELESRDSYGGNASDREHSKVRDVASDYQHQVVSGKDSKQQPVASPDGGVRKRTYPSEDSSDSDNVPLIKKVRRDSEISLHYNEDEDDETGLTNGAILNSDK